MTEYETMIYERKGKTAYIMFNRPQSLNAMNDQFERDFHDALLEFDVETMCFGHFPPLRGDVAGALRKVIGKHLAP